MPNRKAPRPDPRPALDALHERVRRDGRRLAEQRQRIDRLSEIITQQEVERIRLLKPRPHLPHNPHNPHVPPKPG